MSYRIAAPDEYLAVTGMGISTVRITKAAWVWPFQRCRRFRYARPPLPSLPLPGGSC